jgi:Dimerisation and cyclophilin-binding domain of Mon2
VYFGQSTVPLILNTLRSVVSQGVEIQLKILQTLVSLLTNCKDIHGDLLAEVTQKQSQIISDASVFTH